MLPENEKYNNGGNFMQLILLGFGALLVSKIVGLLHVDSSQEKKWKELKQRMVNDYRK